MKIIILTANSETTSTKKLYVQGKRAKHKIQIINPQNLQIFLTEGQVEVRNEKNKKITADVVIPRLGSISMSAGLTVLDAFAAQGCHIINSTEAISKSINKLRSLTLLHKAGLPIPLTVFANRNQEADISQFRNDKYVVIKLLQGSQGYGVSLIHTAYLPAVLQTLRTSQTDVIIQKYISESKGEDYRLIVYNNQVIASMKRKATKSDFRANLAQGGKAYKYTPSDKEIKLALDANKTLGLNFSGVDLIKSKKGVLILEVNPFPGLGGIEKINKINIAKKIIDGFE